MTADILAAPRDELAPSDELQQWPYYWATEIAPYLGARVAEIGASAAAIPAAAYLNGDAEQWVCVEPHRHRARRLSLLAARGELGPRCSVLNGWIVDLPQNDPFDTILYVNTLERIPADRTELEDAAKRLKRGGYLVVLSDAHPSLYSHQDATAGIVRRYRQNDLLAIEPQGFQLTAMGYLDLAGYIATKIGRFLSKTALSDPKWIAFWDRKLVPLSWRCDRFTGHRLGKSVLAVWQRIV